MFHYFQSFILYGDTNITLKWGLQASSIIFNSYKVGRLGAWPTLATAAGRQLLKLADETAWAWRCCRRPDQTVCCHRRPEPDSPRDVISEPARQCNSTRDQTGQGSVTDLGRRTDIIIRPDQTIWRHQRPTHSVTSLVAGSDSLGVNQWPSQTK